AGRARLEAERFESTGETPDGDGDRDGNGNGDGNGDGKGDRDDDGDEEIEFGTKERPLKLAIVGRPNVGKSTLINALLGEDRLLTGPEAGITRDSITVPFEHEGRIVQLVDTAGLRKKARISEKVESLSAGDTIRSIRYAQTVALLLDGEQGLEKQDLTIARRVIDEGRALVIVINKWDLVRDGAGALKALAERLEISLAQVKDIPIVTLSAKTGKGLNRLLPAVLGAYDVWNRRIPTAKLNRWLMGVQEHHPPPLSSGRRIKIRYITQPKSRPPRFVLFCSKPDDLPESYHRYLVNALREDFDLPGVPIRIMVRKGDNPYAKS
ncbi:MAG: ribosome biogenesis GTPase Der, partial [Rhodospirillales bacterium]